MYANGTVVVQDDDQAFNWLSKAAKQGLKIAQSALVGFYTNSSEKNKDLYWASYWLMKSCLQPDGKSIDLRDCNINSSVIDSLDTFFPKLLAEFPEFNQVESIKYK
jgi:hypothetical protein